MSKARRVLLPLAVIGLTVVISAGCEGVPRQDAYSTIETGFCEQAEEAEDACIQPLDMTVNVHE